MALFYRLMFSGLNLIEFVFKKIVSHYIHHYYTWLKSNTHWEIMLRCWCCCLRPCPCCLMMMMLSLDPGESLVIEAHELRAAQAIKLASAWQLFLEDVLSRHKTWAHLWSMLRMKQPEYFLLRHTAANSSCWVCEWICDKWLRCCFVTITSSERERPFSST